jgi:hypothetical protein
MKTEKKLAVLMFIPNRPLYRESFVKYHFNGVTVYDHRREVLETNKRNRLQFNKKYDSAPAMVQLVDRHGYLFINIFDPSKGEYKIPEYHLNVLAEKKNVLVEKDNSEWSIVTTVEKGKIKTRSFIFLNKIGKLTKIKDDNTNWVFGI